MAKILHLRGECSGTSTVESPPKPVASRGHSVSVLRVAQPVESRREPFPLRTLLEWCAVLLFMFGAMTIMLITLGEITRRLAALGDRNSSFVSGDR